MDNFNKTIKSHIDSGEYFVDARDWYFAKYVYPTIERSLVFIIATTVVFAAFIGGNTIASLFPITKEVPLILAMPNADDRQPVITLKPNKTVEPQMLVTNYLLRKYIIDRESYAFDKVERQIAIIHNNSSKLVAKKFENYIKIQNPDSPILLYQTSISREIEIISTKKVMNDYNNWHVKYRAILIDEENNKIESLWLANVFFNISDIEALIANKEKFEFLVTEYNTEQIK